MTETNIANPAQTDTVTVVVPTRNRPELLRQTLRAIAQQDFAGSITTIVVFDQTEPDLTIESDADRRQVRVVTNGRKPGLAGARNTGIDLAGSTFVAFCDDDDTWAPDKLRHQVDQLKRSGRGMAVGAIEVHYEGTVTRRVAPMAPIEFADLLRSRITEAHPSTFLFRRDLLDQIGHVDEAIPGAYAEDYEYLLRAAKVTAIDVVDQATTTILWHTASFFVENWQTRIDALTYLLAAYPEFTTEPVGHARIQGQIAFAHAAMGNGSNARRWALTTLKSSWREGRAYLAVLVSTRLVSADRVVAFIQRRGRGI